MKKSTVFRFSLLAAVCGLLILQSCEKDPVTPPVDNSASVKPYILVNGQKFVCARPYALEVIFTGRDSLLFWAGTGFSDTMLSVYHQTNGIKVGTFKIDSTGFGGPGFITCFIWWGNQSTSLILNLMKGSYELKRENGKYVSYLKNGEAIYDDTDHSKRFKNIEFKVIWPY